MISFTLRPGYQVFLFLFSTIYILGQLIPIWSYFLEYARLTLLGAKPVLAPSFITFALIFHVVVGLLAVFMFAVWRRIKLTFAETTFAWTTPLGWGSWQQAYTDVVYVTGYSYGQLVFKTQQGKIRFLPAHDLQAANTTVLAELQRRLPPTCFAPNLRQRLFTLQWLDIALWGLSGYLWCMMFYGAGAFPVFRDQLTWPRLYGSTTEPSHWAEVSALTLAEQGWPRFITGGNATHQPLMVWQATAQGFRTWSIPPLKDWWAKPQYPRIKSVMLDAQGQPLVLMEAAWLLAWDGAAWQVLPSPFGSAPVAELAVRGPHVWALGYALPEEPKRALVYWDTTRNFTATLALPTSPAGQPFTPMDIALTLDNQLLVHARSGNQEVLLSRPLALTLPAQGEWVTLAAWSTREAEPVLDFARAPNGDVWLWVNPITEVAPYLRHYVAATATWHTYPLPATLCCQSTWLNGLVVDTHNRLWLHLSDQIAVLQPAAPGILNLLVRYTAENSNALANAHNGQLQMGADGRVWAWAQTVVWADTSAQLPFAIPFPFTFAANTLTNIGGLVIIVLSANLLWILTYWACRRELARK